MIGRGEARSIMPNVAVSTLLVTSAEWLLETSPQAKGHWLALLGYCTREENGGRIAGAAHWGAERWLHALGADGSQGAVEKVVSERLAEWAGDDLIVAGYALDLEHSYQQSRAAGKKGVEEKRKRKLAKLAGGKAPEGDHGEPPPASPLASPPKRGPVGLGEARKGDVGEGDVGEGTAPAQVTKAGCLRPEQVSDANRPDPLATLNHCFRARAGTTATEAEKRELVRYNESLSRDEAEQAVAGLWDYWQREKSPSVTGWLTTQGRRPG